MGVTPLSMRVDVIGATVEEGTLEPNLNAIVSCVRLLPPGNRIVLKRLGYVQASEREWTSSSSVRY